MRPATSTTRSARAKAQRPQLVPRERDDANVAPTSVPSGWKAPAADGSGVDLDAATVRSRGTSTGEWNSEEEDVFPLTTEEQGHTVNVHERFLPTPTAEEARIVQGPLAAPAPLTLGIVSYGDIDRLWDWARQDAAGVSVFLGMVPAHSQELYAYINNTLEQERAGAALLRSLYIKDIATGRGLHLGFVALSITRMATPIGAVRVYMAPTAQAALPTLLPLLFDTIAAQVPDLTLAMSTDDYALAKSLESHHFHLSIALTRPPANLRK